ncbi:electron transfer flavoprotein subunit alpha/FixB family protein [Propionibacterium australiense]|uniref:Electron transfer flavoprotein subunit alpha/FixB family protein n=1 Tax=Propionibacterium australiense TaxID=119981 RepID=A0A383S4E4_9ACTN|nr:electron transfer flavoprotein subunit alpha/FixB family protein [Propionibacterium australiense]RLP11532.1 electron transfer flavoprotein subunit alpha/FixB family protein [Propionibacterium australiense]RLP12734.1 electron transfer flavoprotein subunit alpha/FixB family protein [Propionibacterium australiense]SYZ32244.1 Electron transfer flavoprotein, alpha subunit, C-terminal [Propionibacterium australiense]VEH90597.1 Electron transfer flavoprotein large subunit [Propionibacterium austral
MTTWIITTNNQIAGLLEVAGQLSAPTTIVGVGTDSLPEADQTLTIPLPEGTPAEAAAPAVTATVDAQPGDVVLVPNRAAERVLAGSLAVNLGAPVLTGLIAVTDGIFELDRFGGIAREKVTSTQHPVVVVAPGGAEISGQQVATVSSTTPAPLAARITAETTKADTASVDLSSAQRIVAVGRGFRTEADLKLARDLAAALDAELACSRPVAEGVGWMPKESYVGVSGQSVKPDLYVAVGISGQLQHMAGARDAKTIVAINDDKDAPIFGYADYGVIGDLYEVLPALTAALN